MGTAQLVPIVIFLLLIIQRTSNTNEHIQSGLHAWIIYCRNSGYCNHCIQAGVISGIHYCRGNGYLNHCFRDSQIKSKEPARVGRTPREVYIFTE